MDQVGDAVQTLRDWWAGLPPFPDLGLPAPGDPAVLTVVATMVTGLALMGLVTAWVERRLSLTSLAAFILGCALFFWLWETDREGFRFLSVPEAFVEMVARVIR
ncbi:hypothetical protein [Jannaschia helgolandensis]|uniref:hypothetical protein n=1 Tax=Jannaschia helgolandensis TaxID=188906 RepID=UPI0030D877CC|tara:strand:- start:328 stop:639 length:312 start_codon:yes stop_codon:yes gene_type:complete